MEGWISVKQEYNGRHTKLTLKKKTSIIQHCFTWLSDKGNVRHENDRDATMERVGDPV